MKDLNGCYCEASQEAYRVAEKMGYMPNTDYPNARFKVNTLVFKEGWISQDEKTSHQVFKRIYLVNGKFTDFKPNIYNGFKKGYSLKEMQEGLEIMGKIIRKEVTEPLKEKIDHFAKFGFEVPDFECEIWKKGIVINTQMAYIGTFKDCGADIICYWNEDGRCHQGRGVYLDDSYNLTLLKKEWYEKEGAFPCLLWVEDKQRFQLSHNLGNYKSVCELYACRLATNQEIDSLKKDIK